MGAVAGMGHRRGDGRGGEGAARLAAVGNNVCVVLVLVLVLVVHAVCLHSDRVQYGPAFPQRPIGHK